MASSSYSNAPCAACKCLRRKCMPDCVFAPYFPPEEPQKFVNVHKIFGASNVSKLLNEVLPHQREDAVNSLAYEAEARLKDPVYGCVGAISVLQRQVMSLQRELDATNADLIRYACNEIPPQFGSRRDSNEQNSGFYFPSQWNNNNDGSHDGGESSSIVCPMEWLASLSEDAVESTANDHVKVCGRSKRIINFCSLLNS